MAGKDNKMFMIGLLVALLIIAALLYFGGYIKPATTIKSQEQASEAATNISSSVDNVGSILADIDKKLS